MLVPGSRPKIKYEVGNYLSYLQNQVDECQKNYNLNLMLNTLASKETLQAGKFECVILCGGGKTTKLPVTDIDSPPCGQCNYTAE